MKGDTFTTTTATTDCGGASLDEHLELALCGLALMGQTVKCPDVYRALLVLAEVGRRVHGHAAYDPSEEAEKLVIRAEAAKARLDEQTRQRQAALSARLN